MKRGAVIALKLLGSVPLALIIGGVGARILENGLWPLLLFSDHWLSIIDFATVVLSTIVVFVALLRCWVFER